MLLELRKRLSWYLSMSLSLDIGGGGGMQFGVVGVVGGVGISLYGIEFE